MTRQILSKPISTSRIERAQLYLQHSFRCPVCTRTGGPKFSKDCSSFDIDVTIEGVRIPADHIERCLPILRNALIFKQSKGKARISGVHNLHFGLVPCLHPECLSKRLWGTND